MYDHEGRGARLEVEYILWGFNFLVPFPLHYGEKFIFNIHPANFSSNWKFLWLSQLLVISDKLSTCCLNWGIVECKMAGQ